MPLNLHSLLPCLLCVCFVSLTFQVEVMIAQLAKPHNANVCHAIGVSIPFILNRVDQIIEPAHLHIGGRVTGSS